MEENPAASPSRIAITFRGSLELFALSRRPAATRSLHLRMSEKSVALISQEWTVHNTAHIAACGHFCCRYLDLVEVMVCVLDGRSVDNAIEPSPQRRAHAHRARLAGGVERVASERKSLKALGRKS